MNHTHTCKLAIVGSLLFFCASGVIVADTLQGAEIAPVGRRIVDVVDYFRSQGFQFAYSTSLLGDEILVVKSPTADDPLGMVAEILRPHDLVVQDVDGIFVISRAVPPSQPVQTVFALDDEELDAVPEVTVSASRYELLRNLLNRGVFVDQQRIQQMPVLGDDPIRATHRIPGTASNGVSAKSYVRGGESADTGIILDGSQLLAPFHVRNFQSLFSTIDVRAVEGVEVFTGGFPVQYGNRMGGLIVIDTIPPTTERHSEIGLSVFNTSVLTSGSTADARFGWLVSARRGNLDLVVDEEYGKPGYSDFFGHLETNFSEASSVSFNALVAVNDVELVTENNPAEREESASHSRNNQFWFNWQQSWSDALESVTTVTLNDFDDHRVEAVNDPEEIVGGIDDFRAVNIARLGQHWVWQLDPSHEIKWGAEYERLRTDYAYDGIVGYFGVFRLFDNLPQSIERHTDQTIRGETFSAYLADRWTIAEGTVAELGIRWDKQTYAPSDPDGQFSPRFSIVHAIGPATDLRASIGRYYQAQQINQLQVEDAVNEFLLPQRSDQIIVGLQRRIGENVSLRAEAYWKDVDRVHARFENVLNPITVLPEFKPDRMMVAPTAFRSRGLELSIERRRKNGFGFWASYVLSDAEDTIDGRRVPRSWDQPNAIQAGLSWVDESWEIVAVATEHSGWPKTSLEFDPESGASTPALVFTPRNEQRFGHFATLDMRVRYRTPIRYGTLSMFFELSNATNRRNPCCVDFEVAMDNGATPALQFEQKDWLPLLPAAGILWEF